MSQKRIPNQNHSSIKTSGRQLHWQVLKKIIRNFSNLIQFSNRKKVQHNVASKTQRGTMRTYQVSLTHEHICTYPKWQQTKPRKKLLEDSFKDRVIITLITQNIHKSKFVFIFSINEGTPNLFSGNIKKSFIIQ